MLVLGLPFFTSAYMLVDNDKEEITLWQAQASKAQDLVAVGTPDCRPSVSASASVPTNSPTSILHPGVARATISNGAIAGASVGGLLGIVTVFAAFLLLRRRSNRRRTAEPIKNLTSDLPSPPAEYAKPELASDQIPPQEMPLVQHTRYDLAPYELSEGRDYGELPAEPPAVPEKDSLVSASIIHEMSTAPKTPKKGRFSRVER